MKTALRVPVFCLLAWLAFFPTHAALGAEDSIARSWHAYKAGAGAVDASLGSLALSTMPIDTQGVTRTVRLVTKSAYPGANLYQEQEAVFLTVHDLEVLSSGATTSFQFGLTPDNANANIYTRANAFYFAQNGTANASLTLRDNGVATTLWSTTNASLLSVRYNRAILQFTRTTWALTLHDANGSALVNEAGNLPAPLGPGWAGGLHAHLTMNQSSNNSGYTTLLIDGLDLGREGAALLPLIGEPATLPASSAFTEDFMTLESWHVYKSGAGASDPAVGGLELATTPVTMHEPGAETWAGWRSGHFTPEELDDPAIGGPSSDPDGDGVSNLLEYALGGLPRSADAGLLPQGHLDGEGRLALTFHRQRADLVYTVQAGDDLARWSDLAVNPGAVGETVTVPDTSPTGATRRFLRLRVEQGVTRTVRVVTQSALPAAGLLQGEETIGLSLRDLEVLSSGATTSFQLGFTPDGANANIHTRANAFYFVQNGTASASLMLRDNGVATTLWSTADATRLGAHYSRAFLLLGRTTWALVLYDAAGSALVNAAGELPASLGPGWATGLHAHIAMHQSGNNGGHATLLIDGLDADRKDTSTLYPLAGEPAVLRLDAPAGVVSVNYTVRNYASETIAQGTAAVDAAGKISVSLTPPSGFFEIVFDGDNASATGFWSMTTARRSPSRDPFFSTDAAISLVPADKRAARMEPLSRMIADGGLARERFTWSAINPAENQWDWNASQFPARPEALRQTYLATGIKILELLHNAPTRLGGDPAYYGAFPLDMIGAYDSTRTIAGRWHEVWGGLEVWNEPDNPKQSAYQPFDKYAALLKAVRLALHDEGVQAPVGSGVFAQFKREYVEDAIRNGMLENSDFVSFHYYGDPLRLEELVSQWRDMLAWHGHPAKPLWITEAATYADGVKNVRLSVGEQARVARVVTMQAIEAKACGIARHFPFLFSDYTENETRRFGFLDPKGTPVRAFAALAEVSRRLDGHDYIGDIPVAAYPGIRRIRVFAPSSGLGQAVVVLYTGDENIATGVTLPVYAESATGIDGRALPVARTSGGASSIVTVADGLAYLNVARGALQSLLVPDAGTMALQQWGKTPPPPPTPPCPVIMQAHLDPAQVEMLSIRGYYVSEETDTLQVGVWLSNLSDTPRQATIGSLSIAAPVSITIPPRSRQELTLAVNVASLVDTVPASDRRWLTLTGQTGEGTQISPVTLPVVVDDNRGIAARLGTYAYRFELPLAEGYRWARDGWQQDANGILTFNHNETPWSYDVTFNPGNNKWAFPRYLLPQEIDLSRVTGVLFRGRCQNPATVRLMAWDAQGNGTFTNNEVVLPADNEWHVVYVPFYNFVAVGSDGTPLPGQLKRFSVGMNSEADVNRIEISEIHFVGQ